MARGDQRATSTGDLGCDSKVGTGKEHPTGQVICSIPPVSSGLPARWLLLLDGGPEGVRAIVAARVAGATGAAHLVASPASSSTNAAATTFRPDGADRIVVETAPGSDTSAIADLGRRQNLPLLQVRLSLPQAKPSAEHIRMENLPATQTAGAIALPGDLTSEQVVALLMPCLGGPRQPTELAAHLSRRLSILSLAGLPVAGHPIVEQLTQHLESDAADEGLLDKWFSSTIIDEHTAQPVLHRETFEWIDQFVSGTTRWPVSHAGLAHTYGYILSSAWTPFGWKADRYLDGKLAAALNIGIDDLTPWAARGTVLSNLTDALDAMTSSEKPSYIIEERGQLVGPLGVPRDGTLRTRIFEGSALQAERLLVYTIEFAEPTVERYVTAFPMGEGGVGMLLNDTESRSRFNVAETLLSGSRTVRTG